MRIVLDSLAVRLTIPHLTDDELAAIRMAFLEATAAANRGDVGRLSRAAPALPLRAVRSCGRAPRAGGRRPLGPRRALPPAAAVSTPATGNLVRLGEREHAAILEAAEQRDARSARSAWPSISRARR